MRDVHGGRRVWRIFSLQPRKARILLVSLQEMNRCEALLPRPQLDLGYSTLVVVRESKLQMSESEIGVGLVATICFELASYVVIVL